MRNIYNNKLKKFKELNYDSCDFVSINCMKDAVNFPYEIVGQAFVLKMLLQNDIEVVNGEIIDHSGILD